MNAHEHDPHFVTLTFVVRALPDQVGDDPRALLSDEAIQFWGSEAGVSDKAVQLGAEPDGWADDADSSPLYQKCAHCHLFVERNDVDEDDPEVAEYVHLSRDDAADQAVEATHDAAPSGLWLPLDSWKKIGPVAMRVRFDDYVPQVGDHALADTTGSAPLPDLATLSVREMAYWFLARGVDSDYAFGPQLEDQLAHVDRHRFARACHELWRWLDSSGQLVGDTFTRKD